MFFFRLLSVLAWIGFLFFPIRGVEASSDTSMPTAGGRLHLGQRDDFPKVKLRGYGSISGSCWSAPDPNASASILQVNCQDEASAKLFLAKYLSDFGLLPGVTSLTVNSKRGPLTGRQADGQGAILGLRSGMEVFILAAAQTPDLQTLVDENLPAALKIDATEGEIPVPMYLDRWDKYGFRFYYGPLVKPTGMKTDYDPTQDFEFAEKSDHAGLAVWENTNTQDTGEGIMDTPHWDWALAEATKRGLPFGINFGMANTCWAYNRDRASQLQGQPQFLGGWYGMLGFGPMALSWNAPKAANLIMSQMQQTVRRFKDVDNVVSWMEPHEECGGGPSDELVEFGPLADIGYREYLKTKYANVGAVSKRWFGNSDALKSWNDVHVPELASFLGWDKDAIDLTGTWRVNFDVPYDQTSAATQLDDSAWATLPAPGNACVLSLPRAPAVYRRHINIDPAWRAAHEHFWLYVWDLNDNRGLGNAGYGFPPGKFVQSYVNGQLIPETSPNRTDAHWSAVDVSATLTSGDNLITVLLPWGFFNYRAYLSPHPPKQYPELGPQMNAQWVDFSDWNAWSRGQALLRGVQMIRQIDPNRPITMAAPDSYASEIKPICEDYGCVYHNTGYMAGFWANWHCMDMASAGLATDAEPGNGAYTLLAFKQFLGRWSTEGVQGVDYFQHIGDILWKDDIRDYFKQTLNLWHVMGKYHTPKAEVAMFESNRNTHRLLGFPWRPDPKIAPLGGIVPVRINEWLLATCPVERILEGDFQRPNISSYKIIFDTNTVIMDKSLIDQIEKWVRAGGIFVTFGQTGRHTTTEMDAWPINQLTGYSVIQTDVGGAKPTDLAPNQPILKDPYWSSASNNAYGMSLHKEKPECQDLLLWKDGSTAIGMRPLGKGFVIDVAAPTHAPQILKDIVAWAGVHTVPATAEGVLMRNFVSNNGLYAVWTMWNQTDKPTTTDLIFRNDLHPATAIDVKTGEPVAVQSDASGVKISGLAFEPWETRVFLTPRTEIAQAPARWFQLQRGWWQGTADPGPPLPPFKPKLSLPLTEDWAFKPLDPVPANTQPPDATAWADPKLDDSRWERRPYTVFNRPDHPEITHAMFRKRFMIPADWKNGTYVLWAEPGSTATPVHVFIDGKLLERGNEKGGDITDALKAGGAHVLAIEAWDQKAVIGPVTGTWIAFKPTPAFSQNLAGDWDVSMDALHYTTLHLPGPFENKMARRIIHVDATQSARNVVVHIAMSKNNVPFGGVIVNGHLVSHIFWNILRNFDLNVTPYIKFGQDNEIIFPGTPAKNVISEISLDYYEKNAYP
jgi:hypothetical protein